MGYFPRPDALEALLQALEQRDFGVCHAAEQSLMRLTGRTFNHDPLAWKAFIEEADDPFAQRGALDDELKGNTGGAWWRLGDGD